MFLSLALLIFAPGVNQSKVALDKTQVIFLVYDPDLSMD